MQSEYTWAVYHLQAVEALNGWICGNVFVRGDVCDIWAVVIKDSSRMVSRQMHKTEKDAKRVKRNSPEGNMSICPHRNFVASILKENMRVLLPLLADNSLISSIHMILTEMQAFASLCSLLVFLRTRRS
jgi:hypothetical protein